MEGNIHTHTMRAEGPSEFFDRHMKGTAEAGMDFLKMDYGKSLLKLKETFINGNIAAITGWTAAAIGGIFKLTGKAALMGLKFVPLPWSGPGSDQTQAKKAETADPSILKFDPKTTTPKKQFNDARLDGEGGSIAA